jgi:hypothetical protein
MSKKKSKISTKNSMSVFPGLFCFIAFSGVFQRWEFKNATKNVLQKKSCRKVFTKNSTKNPKPIFSRILFYHVFGRFSMKGVQKHDIGGGGGPAVFFFSLSTFYRLGLLLGRFSTLSCSWGLGTELKNTTKIFPHKKTSPQKPQSK